MELECVCESGGFVGVFTVAAPNPIHYPGSNEVNITIKLTTTERCSSTDAQAFIQALSDQTSLDRTRFVGTTCTDGGVIFTKLRPAFRRNQTSNSDAMQAIKRVLLAPTGFIAYGSVKVVNVSDAIVQRSRLIQLTMYSHL